MADSKWADTYLVQFDDEGFPWFAPVVDTDSGVLDTENWLDPTSPRAAALRSQVGIKFHVDTMVRKHEEWVTEHAAQEAMK